MSLPPPPPSSGPVIALVMAAGSGQRMQDALPKQYHEIRGKTLLAHTVERLLSHPGIHGVRVVTRREDHARYRQAMQPYRLFPMVVGGATRQESVLRGLESLAHARPGRVLIHDAARPLLSHALIDRILNALDRADAVVPVLPVQDTLRLLGDTPRMVDRTGLYAMQTPQAFHYHAILEAHRKLAGANLTDDIALFEQLERPFQTVEGEVDNFKITQPVDLTRLQHLLEYSMETRTAMGYDVHALMPHQPETPVAKQHLKICGIYIPHTHYLEGHSDADVGMHALVDALLGTMCEGDIGTHFPPNDPQWKGANSDRFLLHAFELLTKRGGRILHLDLTLICERPKLAPHREAMRDHISQFLKLEKDRISIKATTTEKLGFTGRGEGIAAQAVATVQLPV